MANIKGALASLGAHAFGLAQASSHAARKERARQAQADELAAVRRQRDEARVELEKARRQSKAKEVALLRGITDAVRLQRIANLTESEHARCAKTGERFDLTFAVAQAVHKDKTAAGEQSVPPVPPNGPAFGAPPIAFAERLADDERYRARLRELGIIDPRTGSYPGEGGPFGGGPLGGW